MRRWRFNHHIDSALKSLPGIGIRFHFRLPVWCLAVACHGQAPFAETLGDMKHETAYMRQYLCGIVLLVAGVP